MYDIRPSTPLLLYWAEKILWGSSNQYIATGRVRIHVRQPTDNHQLLRNSHWLEWHCWLEMSIRKADSIFGWLHRCKFPIKHNDDRIYERILCNSSSGAFVPTSLARTLYNFDTPPILALRSFCLSSCWSEYLHSISCCWPWRELAKVNRKSMKMMTMLI